MAENDLDSGQSSGTPVIPNAGSSAGSGDSNGSSDALKLQSTIEALTKKLDEVDARSKALQSDKDRGISKTKDEVAELKRKIGEIEKLKKAGLDEDGAIEELSFRDEIRSVREQLSKLNSPQAQPAGNGPSLVADKGKLLSEYGLSENDPDVAVALAGKNFSSDIELENAALKIAYKRANKPQPDASASITPQGLPVPKASVEADIKKYQTEMIAARGNRQLGQQIKEKYRKAGVPVDQVTFTV